MLIIVGFFFCHFRAFVDNPTEGKLKQNELKSNMSNMSLVYFSVWKWNNNLAQQMEYFLNLLN